MKPHIKSNPILPTLLLWQIAIATTNAAVRYVDLNSANSTPPYTSWATAATNIQDAVDAAVAGDQILVTNGVYQTGSQTVPGPFGPITNRVVVGKPVTLQSVNGPAATQIVGATNSMRCVYLATGATIVGFTLTNGAANSGGGVWCGSASTVVSNCIIVGNSASHNGGGACGGTLIHCTLAGNVANIPGYGTNDMGGGGAVFCALVNCTLTSNSVTGGPPGGGAYECTLSNCSVIGNSGDSDGGGVASSALKNCLLFGNLARFGGGAAGNTLDNCTIVGNSASISAGGVSGGTLNNCIVYYNTAPSDPDHSSGGTYNYSCTTAPLPLNGVGSIANAPLFVDAANGDFRLQSNSPCINSGRNAYAPAGPDLDGNPRIAGGTVDIGAYEFQSPSSVLSYAWAQQYSIPTDGSADYADSDSDRMNNWQEWIAGTVPTDDSSTLRMLNPSTDASGVTVSWQSVSNRAYFLERTTNLGAMPPFSLLTNKLVGQPGTTSFTDTNATGPGPFFYRVGVQP